MLGVRHDKAMLRVDTLAKNHDFGSMYKMYIEYNKGQFIDTYQLNKRQSIAVAAMLNTSLLMRVIDRWQELEKNKSPTNLIEALQLALEKRNNG